MRWSGRPQGSPLRKCWNACVGRAALSPPPDNPPHPSGGVRARRPTTEHFVGQSPCALPWVREKSGSGRCRHRPLRRFDKKVPAWNPPVTALPCQPPLGKGTEGTGLRIATASVRTGFAMTGFFARGCGTRPGGSSGRPTPTHRLPIDYRRGRRPRRPASVIRGAALQGVIS